MSTSWSAIPRSRTSTPLTDHALSILGKKIGTTRVTVYGEGKKLVGIFDVEVSYDITRLATEIARFTGGGIKVSSVNGRIMLSGNSPDAVTLDKAVTMARQFAPDVINTVQVMQAAAGRAGGALRRSDAPGDPRPWRAVEHVRQPHARQYRRPDGGRKLPITSPDGSLQQPRQPLRAA